MKSISDIPMLPVMSWTDIPTLIWQHQSHLVEDKHLFLVNSGRAAIALALRISNIGAGDEVLVPAYHCPSMVYPVQWLGASPVYYCIDRSLRPNIQDIKVRISGKTRAILAAHFFGQANDFRELRELCDENDIELIEDCAHTLFGFANCGMIGRFGDYSISSPRKFFPVQDGGLLFSDQEEIGGLKVDDLGRRFDLKMSLNTLESSGLFGRMKPLGSVAARLGGAKKQREGLMNKRTAANDSPSKKPIDAINVSKSNWQARIGKISAVSARIIRSASVDKLVERRRYNFQLLSDGLSSSSNYCSFKCDEQEEFVPYAFILKLADPDKHHAALRAARVPVWRWDSLMTDICSQSTEFSRSLIQIPCHQSLTEQEVAILIDKVRGIVNK